MEQCDPYITLMDYDISHGEDDLSKQALFSDFWVLSKTIWETQSAVDGNFSEAQYNPRINAPMIEASTASDAPQHGCISEELRDFEATTASIFIPCISRFADVGKLGYKMVDNYSVFNSWGAQE
ncbi:hypothetical protein GQ607_015682 [Colletotrichum asianum]|uniref:Uncharacterized protein n=1 Tax=Colletotrichum asianum TaxID=702518 RepID=A0A8H3ZMK1_9PEZI|nr:hypothetical protein GQ607_015682 [Colletotrichum asianum]